MFLGRNEIIILFLQLCRNKASILTPELELDVEEARQAICQKTEPHVFEKKTKKFFFLKKCRRQIDRTSRSKKNCTFPVKKESYQISLTAKKNYHGTKLF